MTQSPTAAHPTFRRASTAIDEAIEEAELNVLPGSERERLKQLRETARAVCGEFFARVAARRLPPPPCPGCEARALDPQPRRGGHR